MEIIKTLGVILFTISLIYGIHIQLRRIDGE